LLHQKPGFWIGNNSSDFWSSADTLWSDRSKFPDVSTKNFAEASRKFWASISASLTSRRMGLRSRTEWKVGGPTETWSQYNDFWIYSYNASVVFSRLERFHSMKKYFCFKNALGYLWRCEFLRYR
jgi:hypothetical protein